MLKFLMHETKNGNFDLDVGCMQINLKWHGKYFKKISDSVRVRISHSLPYTRDHIPILEKKAAIQNNLYSRNLKQ